jgi:outer membrane protein OmpA-like peptidoglycan-associated protein
VEVKVVIVTPQQAAETKTVVPPPVPEKKCDLPESTIYFDFDKSAIRSKEIQKIYKMAEWLKINQQCKVQVEGHTCVIGTNMYNAGLGERRARAVYDVLVAKGVKVEQFVSVGENKPADEQLEKNRRVIIRIIGPASGK